MTKQERIEKLLNRMAEGNNVIDLNAYASGLADMYDDLSNSSKDEQNVISTQEKPDKPTKVIDDTARSIYQGGEILRAVKYLNKYTNMKLKEAKEYVNFTCERYQ